MRQETVDVVYDIVDELYAHAHTLYKVGHSMRQVASPEAGNRIIGVGDKLYEISDRLRKASRDDSYNDFMETCDSITKSIDRLISQ